jgi:hypothetical protein
MAEIENLWDKCMDVSTYQPDLSHGVCYIATNYFGEKFRYRP